MDPLAYLSRQLWGMLLAVGVLFCLLLISGIVHSTEAERPQPGLEVSYQVKGRELHLQLKVAHFHFSLDNMGKDNRYGEGHARLYIDGNRVAKIFDEQFVFADLTPGKHQVEVELAHNNHDSYEIRQRFEIEVKK